MENVPGSCASEHVSGNVATEHVPRTADSAACVLSPDNVGDVFITVDGKYVEIVLICRHNVGDRRIFKDCFRVYHRNGNTLQIVR